MNKIYCTKLGRVSKDAKVIITDGRPARNATHNVAGGNKVVDTNVKKLHSIYHKFSESQK